MPEAALSTAEMRILRALKKTAAVFILLLRLARPAGVKELSGLLEINPETVRNHLRSLAAVGLAVSDSTLAYWRLTPAGSGFLFGGCADSAPAAAVGINNPGKETPAESVAPASGPFRQARDALRQAGIGEPTASRLAALEHVTLEFIQAHTLRARQEKAPTGLLVHRLRSNDPAPELNARGHLHGCTCDPCQRARYATE